MIHIPFCTFVRGSLSRQEVLTTGENTHVFGVTVLSVKWDGKKTRLEDAPHLRARCRAVIRKGSQPGLPAIRAARSPEKRG